jgi:hypothetical protein
MEALCLLSPQELAATDQARGGGGEGGRDGGREGGRGQSTLLLRSGLVEGLVRRRVSPVRRPHGREIVRIRLWMRGRLRIRFWMSGRIRIRVRTRVGVGVGLRTRKVRVAFPPGREAPVLTSPLPFALPPLPPL